MEKVDNQFSKVTRWALSRKVEVALIVSKEFRINYFDMRDLTKTLERYNVFVEEKGSVDFVISYGYFSKFNFERIFQEIMLNSVCQKLIHFVPKEKNELAKNEMFYRFEKSNPKIFIENLNQEVDVEVVNDEFTLQNIVNVLGKVINE